MDIRSVSAFPPVAQPVAPTESSRQPSSQESVAAAVISELKGQNELKNPVRQSGNADKSADKEPEKPTTSELIQKEIEASLERVNETVKLFNSSIRFDVDKETHRQIVRVVDIETEELIRQIPSEDLLSISRALDKLQGLLIKDKA